jgi:hypothetical protein
MVLVNRHMFRRNLIRSTRLRLVRTPSKSLPLVARTMATSSDSDRLAPFTPKAHVQVKIPKFIYGTAWKKERTADLVYQAIKSGFRAIDTAAQPRHYQENLAGEGIRRAINEKIVRREELHVS